MKGICVDALNRVGTIPNMPKRTNKNGSKAASGDKKRPNRTGRALGIWISDELGKKLDDFLENRKPKTTLTAVIELALEEFFEKQEG